VVEGRGRGGGSKGRGRRKGEDKTLPTSLLFHPPYSTLWKRESGWKRRGGGRVKKEKG